MLAQSFKSAAELGITEKQRDALAKTLVLLETERLTHIPNSNIKFGNQNDEMNEYFNMALSYGCADCGSVGCIRGTAERVGNVSLPIAEGPIELRDLFYNPTAINSDPGTAQAAAALRSYLTNGEAMWADALKIGQSE